MEVHYGDLRTSRGDAFEGQVGICVSLDFQFQTGQRFAHKAAYRRLIVHHHHECTPLSTFDCQYPILSPTTSLSGPVAFPTAGFLNWDRAPSSNLDTSAEETLRER